MDMAQLAINRDLYNNARTYGNILKDTGLGNLRILTIQDRQGTIQAYTLLRGEVIKIQGAVQ